MYAMYSTSAGSMKLFEGLTVTHLPAADDHVGHLLVACHLERHRCHPELQSMLEAHCLHRQKVWLNTCTLLETMTGDTMIKMWSTGSSPCL